MEAEVKLKVVGLIYNQSVINTYSLVMSEENTNRRFSVMIGEFEAQAIALKINNKVLPRPLVHDLINNILTTLNAELKKVLICDLVNDVFYSELHIETSEGKKHVIDSRTSDAIALAIRSDCPIYIKKEILDIVGTDIELSNERKDYSLEDLDKMSDEEVNTIAKTNLEDLLSQAVNEEKYELAVKIRNAMNTKKH